MEGIRNWAFGACAAAVACGVIQLILPKSGMQKVFQVTASVFFLGCLLSPVFFAMPDPGDYRREQALLQEEIDRRSRELSSAVEQGGAELAAGSIRQAAGEALDELGVEGGKIYVNIHDEADGSISISECEVQLPRAYASRHDEIRGALLQRLGVNVLIGYDDVKNKE